MTRINLVPPEELCDQHLLAELRELTRIPNRVARGVSTEDLPDTYRLGKGHVRFFYDKLWFLWQRHHALLSECHRRGFKGTTRWPGRAPGELFWRDYTPTAEALRENRQRLRESLDRMKRTPTWS